jgi:hypothetical protein
VLHRLAMVVCLAEPTLKPKPAHSRFR